MCDEKLEFPDGIRTMVPAIRIYNMINHAVNAPEGDFVECGVWRGGCLAVLAEIANNSKKQRRVWGFDSFEGLPNQSAKDKKHGEQFVGRCKAGVDEVYETFNKWRVGVENLILCKGWFEDTIPIKSKEINNIALLRLDGDWYESTKISLQYLYPRVVKNGIVIIDDYNTWNGCKVAVDEFRTMHKITDDLHFSDLDGEAWWIKG